MSSKLQQIGLVATGLVAGVFLSLNFSANANKEAANIAHAGIFRRLSLLENASEKFHKWKNVWPWQAQNLEPPTR